ncbi:MAG: 5'-methylthioadenosine/S-adenosylhomocysteine nucleosidase [Metamycoplasmataceae bacterium]
MIKTWGLIIADPNEIHESKLIFKKQSLLGTSKVIHYQWKNIEIIAIESGIGIVNAAMMTQKLIDNFKVEKILNYGAVGATNKVKLYDIVIPNKFYFHDVQTPWYPRGQTPGEPKFYNNAFDNMDNINIASGNSFIYKDEQIKNIREDLDVELFDMEACAIAQVCYKNKLPFFSVKGVSDIINITDSNNRKNINENIEIASKRSLNKLISLFDEIYLK